MLSVEKQKGFNGQISAYTVIFFCLIADTIIPLIGRVIINNGACNSVDYSDIAGIRVN